jgi:hypothetical protein
VIILVVLWFAFGSPKNDIAGMFWSDGPAPWEEVTGFYYPNRNDLTIHIQSGQYESLDGCRSWVYAQARQHDDPGIGRGDYECGVGYMKSWGGINVYRLTLR